MTDEIRLLEDALELVKNNTTLTVKITFGIKDSSGITTTKPKQKKEKVSEIKKEKPVEEKGDGKVVLQEGQEHCIACQGTGKDSKGNSCPICKGTGIKQEEKAPVKPKEGSAPVDEFDATITNKEKVKPEVKNTGEKTSNPKVKVDTIGDVEAATETKEEKKIPPTKEKKEEENNDDDDWDF